MSIEIGSKWVKDGKVVEVVAITSSIMIEVIWFSKKDEKEHILTKDDFLEQYKPYEPVYEYEWIILNKKTMTFKCKFEEWATDEEMEWHIDHFTDSLYLKIVETKRKRVQ